MVVVHLEHISKERKFKFQIQKRMLPELGITKTSVSSGVALSMVVNPSISYLSSWRYFNLNRNSDFGRKEKRNFTFDNVGSDNQPNRKSNPNDCLSDNPHIGEYCWDKFDNNLFVSQLLKEQNDHPMNLSLF